MNMKKILLLAVCLLGLSSVYAQDVVKVRKAVGRWEVSDDITPKQAEERALNEAKKEALRMAGVMENVWSVFGQVTSDSGNEFSEAYSSVSMLAISGMVNVTDKEVETEYDPVLKRSFKVVTINANVTKDETQEDKTYMLNIEGIEPVYKDGDVFDFSINIHGSDSYLKFFWFGEDGADLIYPSDKKGNQNQLFKAGQTYKYPLQEYHELKMQKANPAKDVEKVNIIIVATKKDYPYTGGYDFQSILTWIYSLPADQRTLYYTLTLIK